MFEREGLCIEVVDAKIEGKLLKKPTNYRPLPDYLREHVDLYGAESALKTFVKFEATAKKLGFDSIETGSVKIQHEICDAYGLTGQCGISPVKRKRPGQETEILEVVADKCHRFNPVGR